MRIRRKTAHIIRENKLGNKSSCVNNINYKCYKLFNQNSGVFIFENDFHLKEICIRQNRFQSTNKLESKMLRYLKLQ